MTLLNGLVLLAGALALALLAAGQFGAFRGHPPGDLGVRDGRLKPPSRTPNSVSSQAALHAGHPRSAEAAIDPLPLVGPPAAAIARLRALLESMPGARVVEADERYLYAQFTTRWLGFVDDVEFWVDESNGVIHVRSASRIGRRDFGVNRQRVEAIRARLR